jgi:hypothetical protein
MGNLVFQATLGGQVNLVGPNTASTFNLNVPATSSTIATLTGTETFTNKTLTSPTLTTPVLGTPSSGTLTNCTGLPNAGLVNSSVTVGSTAIALGATSTTLAGLTSVASNTLTSAASTALTLQSAGTTAVTIDTSQNVGIGTSSPANRLSVQTTAGNISARFTDNTYSTLKISHADTGGAIAFLNGADQNYAVFGSTSTFYSGSTLTERMRIDSSGKFFVGTTADIAGPGAAQGTFLSTTSGRFGLAIGNTASSSAYGLGINSQTGENVYFYYQGAYKGAILTSAGGTTYGTSSDYRLKENIAPMTGALAKVAKLKPVTYKWKADGNDGEGFIAHELAEVCSQAVTGEKDEVDADGNPKYQGIDTSFLVATLTAALQETKALIDTQAETINALTARIVALEAK